MILEFEPLFFNHAKSIFVVVVNIVRSVIKLSDKVTEATEGW